MNQNIENIVSKASSTMKQIQIMEANRTDNNFQYRNQSLQPGTIKNSLRQTQNVSKNQQKEILEIDDSQTFELEEKIENIFRGHSNIQKKVSYKANDRDIHTGT